MVKYAVLDITMIMDVRKKNFANRVEQNRKGIA
jgi:hypothetical protein